jgi:mannose-6-phosphate isomerase-like protein (cupin superfamily)
MLTIKPWGSYQTILTEPNYKVKRIIVSPLQQLSYQYHNHRKETWKIISGQGIFTLNETKYDAYPDMVFNINIQDRHRIQTISDDPIVFIEVQTGICDEDDIVRLEDDYGRVTD